MSETRGSPILAWLSRRLNLTEMFSLLTSYGLFYAEVDTRKPLPEALAEVLEKPAASYARWPRVLGLIVVVVSAVVIATGALLAFYYLPTPEGAHASVGTLLRDVQFGRLMHQVHFWGAQVLLALLIVRLVRFFLQGVYRPPRELVWVFAALLLLVSLHADLTGRLLPWSSGAFWSSIRALEVVQAVPIYGALVTFLIGGDASLLTDLSLLRFYILHVAVLPALVVLLIYLHFSTVRRVGLSEVRGERKRAGRVAIRDHLTHLAIYLVLVIGLLVTLAVLAPISFESRADPFATVPGAQPPWYLLAPFGFLELTAGVLPRWLAGLLLFLAFGGFLAVPFLDRSRRPGAHPLALAAGALALALWLLLTVYGARVA